MIVLVVDDHPLFLSGVRVVLEAMADDVTVLEACSGQEAFGQLETTPEIDFVCLDLQLPDMNGLEFLSAVRQRRVPVPVVILSAIESPGEIHNALKAGANGYISKTTAREELVKGLQTIARSGHYVSPALRRPLDNFRAGIGATGDATIKLTRRQRQILDLLAAGLGNSDIAAQLNIAESTVKGHLATLYALLNTDTRTACIAEARRVGLLQ
jgi:DNA-binding NarL/FixJ family response regulator